MITFYRKDVADYFLQISKEKMLQMQGNDKSNWSGYTSVLGRINRLQEVTLKTCSKHLLLQLKMREF